MRSRRIGNSFPPAIIACMRAGRPPSDEELKSVAARIEQEAGLFGRFADHPNACIDMTLRAALQATGMVELSAKERNMP